MAGQERFVRSPHLVAYWNRGCLVFYNYATRTRMLATADHCAILDACEQPLSLSGILSQCRGLAEPAARRLLNYMVRRHVVYRAGDARPAAEQAMARLDAWNPAAGFFHRSTQDVLFGERAQMARQQREQARARPMPPPVKRYRGSSTVALPAPGTRGEFPGVLLARRTWRRFSPEAVSSQELATLLGLCAGIHQWIPVRGLGRHGLRTSPSGGARHPIEAYVLALRVTGVPRGLYHYSSDRHELELIRRGVRRGGVDRYLPHQYWYEDAAALVFFSALLERSLWRYEYSRAYRALLIEAGHLCQTFCLTATWLGLAPFCSMALSDSAVDHDLGLDGISESVLYAAGVGRRVADASTAYAPPDVRPPRLVPNPVFARQIRRARR